MPWSGKDFKAKHNKKLSDSDAERAARIANTVLADSGDEGKAVRIANSVVGKTKSKKEKSSGY